MKACRNLHITEQSSRAAWKTQAISQQICSLHLKRIKGEPMKRWVIENRWLDEKLSPAHDIDIEGSLGDGASSKWIE